MFRRFASIVLPALLLSPWGYAQQQDSNAPSGSSQKQEQKTQKPGQEKNAQKPADNASQDHPSSNAEDNPFPEEVSRRAAEKANAESAAPEPKTEAPDNGKQPANSGDPAESSSASRTEGIDWSADPGDKGKSGDMPDTGHDTQRALKDDEVGKLYFAKGDWQGAYNRFKDALDAEPLDADAAFGLAEAAAKLKLKDEAVSAYQKYLELDPDGPKAKASLKALKNLQASSPKQESPK